MFYVKTQLNPDAVMEIDITHENVYCRCPHCGAEVKVNLNELVHEKDFDLCGCSVLCQECTEELLFGAESGRLKAEPIFAPSEGSGSE